MRAPHVPHAGITGNAIRLEPGPDARGRTARDRPASVGLTFISPPGLDTPLDSRTCWTPWSVFQDGSGGLPIPVCAARGAGTHPRVRARPPGSARRGGTSEPLPVVARTRECGLPVRRGPWCPLNESRRCLLEGEISPTNHVRAGTEPRLPQFMPGLSVATDRLPRHGPQGGIPSFDHRSSTRLGF